MEVIRERYEQAINEPGVVGINIGTRPDCLPDETIEYLSELSERMHVTVELGLQTTYETTSDLINRAHSYELYVETVKRLRKYPKIEIVSHLINGLPGETHEMMIENVRRCVTDNDIQGIKCEKPKGAFYLFANVKVSNAYRRRCFFRRVCAKATRRSWGSNSIRRELWMQRFPKTQLC